MKKLLSLLLAAMLLFSLAACGSSAPATVETVEEVKEPEVQETAAVEETPEPVEEEPEVVLVDENGIKLTLSNPKWTLSKDGTYYSLEGVNFCTNVVDEKHQTMNIFVPAAYIDGGDCNGYTAETAPVIIQNNCSGWRSGSAGKVSSEYIAEGFVFVNCGARSRDAGEYGKSPCAVVDLKSAVRTLRLNTGVIPGDMDKIISVGTSGGGQMSSILGASGNMTEYYSYLYESGAPGIIYDEANGEYISTINDDIYGCMCYCPIADIENADLAYAFLRFDAGETEFDDSMGTHQVIEFTPFQLALQDDLAVAFGSYINSIGIKDGEGNVLTFDLNEDGTANPRSGSYYEKTLANISAALNAFIADCTDERGTFSYTHTVGKGKNAEKTTYSSWKDYAATIDGAENWMVENEDGTWSITDIAGFLNGTGLARNKDIPGFDTQTRNAENNAFGASNEEAVHYSASVAAVLKANYDRYSSMEGFDASVVDAYIEEANREDIINQTYLMNATAIMLNKAAGTQKVDPAPYWRTRNGTADEHTSFSVAYNICMAAEMAGCDADYSLVWAMTHGSNEGTSTGTFVQWVHEICD